jgi:hypothetical protein
VTGVQTCALPISGRQIQIYLGWNLETASKVRVKKKRNLKVNVWKNIHLLDTLRILGDRKVSSDDKNNFFEVASTRNTHFTKNFGAKERKFGEYEYTIKNCNVYGCVLRRISNSEEKARFFVGGG